MRSNINKENFEGRIYQHDLALKTSGPQSKNPGTSFIAGNIELAVDENGLNVIPIHFTYVTETYKSGKPNSTFSELKKIIEKGKTWVVDGKDEATKIRVDASIGLNDFYNQDNVLVSSKVNEGSFVTIVNEINADEGERNKFSADMVITGVTRVEADEEKHIDADYVVLKGAIFDFRNALLPTEFTVRNAGGMKYFEDLDISASDPMYTKIWGKVNCLTITQTSTEESAFGEAAVQTYSRKLKSWDVTGTAKTPYDFGDEKVMTAEELTKATQDRQVHLADVKKRADEWKSRSAVESAPNVAAAPSAAIKSGEFHF